MNNLQKSGERFGGMAGEQRRGEVGLKGVIPARATATSRMAMSSKSWSTFVPLFALVR